MNGAEKMLLETLRMDLKTAMKSNEQVKKDILRLTISEIEAFKLRTGKCEDPDCFKVIEKLITSNKETLALIEAGTEKAQKLTQESAILGEYLPRKLTKEQIKSTLIELNVLVDAPDVGRAIGAAMKFFKSEKLAVASEDVTEVVKEMKTPTP